MEIRVRLLADDVRAEGERVTAAFKEWVDAGACQSGGGSTAGATAALHSCGRLALRALSAAGSRMRCRRGACYARQQ